MVLAHELAHIQKHDWMVQVWRMPRALLLVQSDLLAGVEPTAPQSEHACDDAVVRLGAAGTRYAEELAMTRALRSDSRLQSRFSRWLSRRI
jgi:beta-lactamase regulating signal transducer with metallopeptidase domain